MELVSYWTKKKKVALDKAQKVKGAQNVAELKPNLKCSGLMISDTI
jgi:hypothetical protein